MNNASDVEQENRAPNSRDSAVVAGLVNHAIAQQDMPVEKVELYRRDAVVRKKSATTMPKTRRAERGEIVEFSERAQLRLIHFVRNCEADFYSMMTLTYPNIETDGKIVKQHLEKFRRAFLRKFPEEVGVWFLEFQKRGAPHYHILCSLDLRKVGAVVTRENRLRRGDTNARSYRTVNPLEKWLARSWYEIVGSGKKAHLRVGVRWEVLEKPDAALYYAGARRGKPWQKKVPKEYRNPGGCWGKIGKVSAQPSAVIDSSTKEVFELFGYPAMSGRGRVKKYLHDAASKLLPQEGVRGG